VFYTRTLQKHTRSHKTEEGEENGSTTRYKSPILSGRAITAGSAKIQWYISRAIMSKVIQKV